MSKKKKNSGEINAVISGEDEDVMTAKKAEVLSKFRFCVQLSPNLPGITQIFKPGVTVTNPALIKKMLDAGMPIEVIEVVG